MWQSQDVGNKLIDSLKPEPKPEPEELNVEVDETPEVEYSFERTNDKILLKHSYPKTFTKRTFRELKKGKAKVSL